MTGGARAYVLTVGFLDATASGVWLGLIAASLTGFFATFTLWKDILALIVASRAVLGLTIVVERLAGGKSCSRYY